MKIWANHTSSFTLNNGFAIDTHQVNENVSLYWVNRIINYLSLSLSRWLSFLWLLRKLREIIWPLIFIQSVYLSQGINPLEQKCLDTCLFSFLQWCHYSHFSYLRTACPTNVGIEYKILKSQIPETSESKLILSI